MNQLVSEIPALSLLVLSITGFLVYLFRETDRDRARLASVIFSVVLTSASLGLVTWFFWRGDDVRWIDPWCPSTSRPWLVLSPLSAVLLPFSALLSFCVLLGTPRRFFDVDWARSVWLVLLSSVLLATGENLFLLWIGFALGVAPLLLRGGEKKSSFVARVSLLGSTALLLLVFSFLASRGGGFETSLRALAELEEDGARDFWIAVSLVVVVFLRSGVFPFHSWVPSLTERQGSLWISLLLVPQAGALLLLRVGMPLFPESMLSLLPFVARVALLGTLYGALLGLVTRDLRRALGWLVVSQASLVLVGLGDTNLEGLTGALVLWIAVGVSLTGLGLAVASVETRVGSIDLRKYMGLGAQAPLLSASFLILGLAIVGLPGTLGFIAEDLVVHGSLESYPAMGILIVLATAVNGFSVFRAYVSIFGGPEQRSGLPMDLSRREGGALAILLLVLLGFGIVPRGLVEIEGRVAEQRMHLREKAIADLALEQSGALDEARLESR